MSETMYTRPTRGLMMACAILLPIIIHMCAEGRVCVHSCPPSTQTLIHIAEWEGLVNFCLTHTRTRVPSDLSFGLRLFLAYKAMKEIPQSLKERSCAVFRSTHAQACKLLWPSHVRIILYLVARISFALSCLINTHTSLFFLPKSGNLFIPAVWVPEWLNSQICTCGSAVGNVLP